MIPASPEAFTADWLNEALASKLGAATVQSVAVKASDVPGQTAEIAFLDVTYSDPDCGLPTSIVAKYQSEPASHHRHHCQLRSIPPRKLLL